MFDVHLLNVRIMPVETLDADCLTLNWGDFFDSPLTEDLLPSLMNVYDSISASNPLKNATDSLLADESLTAQISRNLSINSFTDVAPIVVDGNGLQTAPHSSCRLFEEYSCSGLQSATPMEMLTSTTETKLGPALSSLHSSQSSMDGNYAEPAKLSTSSRCSDSEDSGIYSSLTRSESLLHDRYSYCPSVDEDLNYINRVIYEIVESELVYVNDLQQIIVGYLDEWKNGSCCLLTCEQINDLFGNIEEIYHFNRYFLWELEQCELDAVKIARCFVENNSNFSIYAAYCTHYPKSIEILTELMRQEKTAYIFRERQIGLHHTLPLGSFLLKPVQRILKYHLLLQNLVNHASPRSVGYNHITAALSTMTGIAHHINSMKRRHEHAVRVQEVQSLLNGWEGADLTVFGELYAEGTFRISGARASRHIFLFERLLLVTKKKDLDILNYKGHIMCSNLMLVECVPKEVLSFQIIPFDNPRMQFTVHARSLEEKRHWTLELKRVILENYSAEIPSHARQLVMELGQTIDSNDAVVEKVSYFKRQHSIPQYLERRKMCKENKAIVRSRILPLFRRLDTRLNYKVPSKCKRSYSVSDNENTVLSNTISSLSVTANSADKSCSNNNDIQSPSKTTEHLSCTCDRMTRTLEGLSSYSESSSSLYSIADVDEDSNIIDVSAISTENTPDSKDTNSSYRQKEQLIEEIIGQLLIASQKFQQAIKEHERSVRLKRASLDSIIAQSDDEDDKTDYDTSSDHECSRLFEEYTAKGDRVIENATPDTPADESLSASLQVLSRTSPNVWLMQQREHLAISSKKGDSLPRTLQPPEDKWRSIRPKTIASDKPSRTADMNLFEGLKSKKKQLDVVTWTTSLSTAATHPSCKFYRSSLLKMTFRRVVQRIGIKFSVGRRIKRDQLYKLNDQELTMDQIEGTYRGSSSNGRNSLPSITESIKPMTATYRQGSSNLGARIANGTELSDYADPKLLFSTMKLSKKTTSPLTNNLLIRMTHRERPPHFVELKDNACSEDQGSDCSLDSFYKKRFDLVDPGDGKSTLIMPILDNDDMANCEMINLPKATPSVEFFRKCSQFNVNIRIHKPIKIPPVPTRLHLTRSLSNLERSNKSTHFPMQRSKTVICESENMPGLVRGWVKQVVAKFQSFD